MAYRRNSAGANYLRSLNHIVNSRRQLTPYEKGLYFEALEMIERGEMTSEAACEYVKSQLGKAVR